VTAAATGCHCLRRLCRHHCQLQSMTRHMHITHLVSHVPSVLAACVTVTLGLYARTQHLLHARTRAHLIALSSSVMPMYRVGATTGRWRRRWRRQLGRVTARTHRARRCRQQDLQCLRSVNNGIRCVLMCDTQQTMCSRDTILPAPRTGCRRQCSTASRHRPRQLSARAITPRTHAYVDHTNTTQHTRVRT
jgi:hypothetical protein